MVAFFYWYAQRWATTLTLRLLRSSVETDRRSLPAIRLYLIANGADAFMVKRALTHKSLQSTQVYVNLGVEHLRDKLNDTINKMIQISKK